MVPFFRLELAKTLKILKLIKANKHREKPFISMAEMIVADLMTKAGLKSADICIEEKRHHGEVNPDGLMIKGTFSLSKTNIHKARSHATKSDQSRTCPSPAKDHRSASQKNKSRFHSGFSNKASSPIHEKEPLMVLGSCHHNSLPERPPSRQKNSCSEFESLPEKYELQSEPKINTQKNPFGTTDNSTNRVDTLEFIDIENDFNDEIDTVKLFQPVKLKPLAVSTSDITVENAIELRKIVFGNATGLAFNPEWMQQSFIFNDTSNLEFGLVQHKGGPCGVLAVVQAFIVKQLLLESTFVFSPSNSKRQGALCKSLSYIIWQAASCNGSSKIAYVCINSGRSKFGSSLLYRCDGITEKLQVKHRDKHFLFYRSCYFCFRAFKLFSPSQCSSGLKVELNQ